jgi:hypothetical protein
MPQITDRISFNGFDAQVERLGLGQLLDEVDWVVTGFDLWVLEERHANGTRGIRQEIDARFAEIWGWSKKASGGIDWSKTDENGRRLGVEVQVSGRSDMVAVDLLHLQLELTGGALDAGVIVVPDDILSPFLTDRTPNLATTIKHVNNTAPNATLQVIAFRHDGPGPPLPKMRTNLGTGQ